MCSQNAGNVISEPLSQFFRGACSLPLQNQNSTPMLRTGRSFDQQDEFSIKTSELDKGLIKFIR